MPRAVKDGTNEFQLKLKATAPESAATDRRLPAVRDPAGFARFIQPCGTEVLHQDALSKLRTAIGRMEKAVSASLKTQTDNAFYWSRMVYGGAFPTQYC